MIKEFFDEIIKILDSKNPFKEVMEEIADGILSIWNYKIFVTSDKQAVLVGNIILGVILFILGVRLAKRLSVMVKKKLSKSFLDQSVVSSLERLSYYFFMMIMVVFVLDVSNVPLTAFSVIGTTLALGVGLGSKNIVNNFMSGIIIMIECPIKLGDIIEVRHIVGKVTNIGARYTSIQTENNINMLIPNSNILEDMIINWTLEDTILRTSLSLIIEDNVEIGQVDAVILKVLNDHPHVLKNPAPQILLKELCKNGYEIEVEFWIDLASSGKSKYIINDINRILVPIFKKNNI